MLCDAGVASRSGRSCHRRKPTWHGARRYSGQSRGRRSPALRPRSAASPQVWRWSFRSPHLERGTKNGEAKTTQLSSASYPCAAIDGGEFIQATGSRVKDRTHGIQFRAPLPRCCRIFGHFYATARRVRPYLLKSRIAPAAEPVKPVVQRIFVIILVVFLCTIERTRGENVRCDRAAEALFELALRGPPSLSAHRPLRRWPSGTDCPCRSATPPATPRG